MIPTTPVSVRYRLTPRGRDLLTAMQPLVAYHLRWGDWTRRGGSAVPEPAYPKVAKMWVRCGSTRPSRRAH